MSRATEESMWQEHWRVKEYKRTEKFPVNNSIDYNF